MKYIVIGMDEGETPLLFPEHLHHDEIASRLDLGEVVSAGSVKVENGKTICFGASEGLGMASRGVDDAVLIGHYLGRPVELYPGS